MFVHGRFGFRGKLGPWSTWEVPSFLSALTALKCEYHASLLRATFPWTTRRLRGKNIAPMYAHAGMHTCVSACAHAHTHTHTHTPMFKMTAIRIGRLRCGGHFNICVMCGIRLNHRLSTCAFKPRTNNDERKA